MPTIDNDAPRFLIQTLGCKVNQYDSERIRAQLLRRGYRSMLPEDDGEPDLIVVNTCSVTSESDRKGRQTIRKLIRRFPQARVMVTGCYSERKPDEIRQIGGVDEIVPIDRQERWVMQVAGEMGWNCGGRDTIRETGQGIERFEEHTRAFVKIQDGCDLKCTFCSIPQSRGKARSRGAQEILDECSQLIAGGYPEIVLCGICIGHYGRDSGTSLPDLVRKISKTAGLKRLRISSLEPQHASDELLDAMRECGDVVCPHLHLPLQSGSDRILRRMNRLYRMDAFIERVQKAREWLPDFELSTDIMAGFPGETEEDFEASLQAIRQCRFSKVHSFRFSAREETPALRMKEHLAPEVIDSRRRELDRLAAETANAIKKSYIGREMAVLVESPDRESGTGFTGNYLRVDFTSPFEVSPGDMVRIAIESVKNGKLRGKAISTPQ